MRQTSKNCNPPLPGKITASTVFYRHGHGHQDYCSDLHRSGRGSMVECPTEVGANCAFHIIIDTTLDKNEGLLSGAEGTGRP